jgi:surface protein
MSYMFQGATSFNQPIGSWGTKTSLVTSMNYMFQSATAFNQNIGTWTVSSVTDMSNMLDYTAISQTNYNSILTGWASLPSLSNGVSFGVLGLVYSPTGETGRNTLTGSPYTWTILGDALVSTDTIYRDSSFDLTINVSTALLTTDDSYQLYYPEGTALGEPVEYLGTPTLAFTNITLSDTGTLPIILKNNNTSATVATYDLTVLTPPDPLVLTYVIPETENLPFTLQLPISSTGIISVHWAGEATNKSNSHVFENAGTYTITITGTGITVLSQNLSGTTGQAYLTECTSFGEIGLTNLSNAFNGCTTLTTVPASLPTTSTVTNMSYMFSSAVAFNQDISDWDVSSVENMSYMFYFATAFNNGDTTNSGSNPLDWADTSSVTNMSYMFQFAEAFNQNIGGWSVSSVTNMSNMFNIARAFNQNISGWDVSSVEYMNDMFNSANAFNQPIGGWGTKTSLVTDMSYMFYEATAFNQDISGWDVSSVTNMALMFGYATSFDQPIGLWGTDTSLVTNMGNMFNSASAFNQDISDWTVSSVTNMSGMFNSASAFNQNIGGWTVSSVTNMSYMFNGASAFNQPIGNWTTKTSRVNDMSYMFQSASAFNQDISGWTVSSVTNMSNMFYAAIAFNQDISGWNVSSVSDMSSMFYNAAAFNNGDTTNTGIKPLDWDTNTRNVTNMSNMFNGASAFNQPIGIWTVSSVTNMSGMFNGASAFNQDISGWVVSSVTDMSNMLDNTAISETNYNSILSDWALLENLISGVPFGVLGLVYSPTGETGRNTLTGSSYNWTILGDALVSTDSIYTETSFDLTINVSTALLTTGDSYQLYYPEGTALGEPVEYLGTSTLAFTNITLSDTGTLPVILKNNTTPATVATYDLTVLTPPEPLVLVYNFTSVTFPFTLQLPISSTGIIRVDWDDGTINQSNSHTYTTGSTQREYTISISGTGITVLSQTLDETTGQTYLTACTSFGEIGLTNLSNAFNGCTTLTSVPASLPTGVTNMQNMFTNARVFNGDISNWDVSNVTNMSYMFQFAFVFNQDIGDWNVENVTNMSEMFSRARAFNQDISGWDVGKVTNMSIMFYGANAFNQPIGNWGTKTSLVTDMSYMFQGASAFNQDLNSWSVSNVTNMSSMFQNATSFNGNISSWLPTPNFTTNISVMFLGAISFNQNISNWDVSKVTALNETFYGATAFNQDIGNWNVEKVTEMNSTFYGATTFNQDIGNWNVEKVTEMNSTFYGATAFNQDISGWEVGIVTTMDSTFYGASSFNQDLSIWSVSNVTNMTNLFSNSGISETNYNKILNLWSIQDVTSGLTFGVLGLVYSSIGETGRNTLTGSPYTWTILGDALVSTNRIIPNTSFELTINVNSSLLTTDDSYQLYYPEGTALGEPVEYLGTPTLAFNNLTLSDTGTFGVVLKNVTVPATPTDVATYDLTVYDALVLTYDLSTLTTPFTLTLPISNGTTISVDWGDGTVDTNYSHTYTSYQIYTVIITGTGITQLSQSISTSGTAYLTGCSSFGDIGLTDLSNAFRGCTNLTTVPASLPTNSTVTNMSYIFYNATSFNQDISTWDVSNVTTMENAFDYTAISETNYNSILNGWASLPSLINGVTVGAIGLVYSPTSETGRNTLVTDNSWAFNGDALSSTDTVTKNTLFDFTINSISFSSGSYYLTYSGKTTDPVTYAGGVGTIEFTGLKFNRIGNSLPLVLNTPGPSNSTITYYLDVTLNTLVCFKEDTKILTDHGYIPIQYLRKGDLIQTVNDGFKAIDMIGKKDIHHSATKERIKDQLYVCSNEKYPEVFEDLVITGCHSILVKGFKDDEQRENTIKINGDTYVTDDHYRLPSCVDDRTSVYEKQGIYTIYHVALDNDNYYFNYGIYANGLLVESCSQRYIKELSGMTLI